MTKIQNRKEFVLNLKFRYLILFGICFLLFGASANSASADYYNQGILRSENLLSGADVTDIASFDVTATIPANTSVSVSFSQDRVNFYSSSGTKAAWDVCANGTSSIDISGLGWSGGLLFYKLKLETTDELATPVVSEVELTYEGEVVPPAGNARYVEGTILSTDLLENSANPLSGFEYFSYVISALPPSTNVYAQFSTDGINFYDSSSTKTAWDTLEFGEHLSEETSLNLSALNWKGQSSFYYKLKLTSKVDNKITPVVKRAGLSSFAANIGKDSEDWLTDGLVGHWKMDEASWNGTAGEVVDASGNGNHGTAVGGASTGAGRFGNGGGFDGTNGYVTIPSSDSLKSIDYGFSVTGWFKTSGAGVNTVIISTYSGGGTGYFYIVVGSDGKIGFNVGDGVERNTTFSTASYNDSVWHHFAAIRDYEGGVRKLYIDGVHVGSSPDGGTEFITFQSGAPAIGANPAGEGIFNGNIDETRIYNRALSPAEVRELYEYAPGPVMHLKMDEMSGTTASDASGNGNDGTLVGGPVWGQGKYGGALKFDRVDDHISVANSSSINPTGITMSAWVYPKTVGGGYRCIMSKNSPSAAGDFQYKMDTSNNNATFRAYVKTDATNSCGVSDSSTFTPNQWYHLSYTYDGKNCYLYRNGIRVGAPGSLVGNVLSDGTNPLNIGRNAQNGLERYDGLLDDVKIYNYARTQKQILEDMNAGHPALKKPILDLSFDEGQGATAHDTSGNGNHGILVPGAGGANVNAAAMWDKGGKIGGAMEFDGVDDYVDLGNVTSLNNLTSEITLSAWVYIRSDGKDHWVFTRSGINSTSGLHLWADDSCTHGVQGNGNTNTFTFNVGSTGDSGDRVNGPSGIRTLNQWHHVVGVMSGKDRKLYHNGSLVASHNSGKKTSVDSTADASYIGRIAPSGEVDGLIDELKIFNYALSDEEIKTLYNGGASLAMGGGGASANNNGVTVTGEAAKYCIPGDTVKCDKPVLELDLDEMTGTTAYDKSGNGNNGTLSGGPTWEPVGKVGGALKFDGVNDSVALATTFTGDQTNTFEFWIKSSSATSFGPVFGRSSQANNEISTYGSNLRYRVSSGTALDIPLAGGLDHWNHFSLVRNGTVITFYRNGINFGSGNIGTTSDIIINQLGRKGWGAPYLNASLDGIKIYDYARTPAQIAWGYNRGKPIAHWKMDETSGTQVDDWSGTPANGSGASGNHGTMVNMDPATDRVDGKFGKALDFDGVDDYVSVSSNLGLTSYPITFSAWVKTTNTGDIANSIVGVYDSTSATIMKNILVMNGVASISITNAKRMDGSKVVSDGRWHNIVGIFVSDSSQKLYVDGVLDSDFIQASPFPTSINRLAIGRNDDSSPGQNFDGQIDNVKVFNYALTPEQIRQQYNNGMAVGF